MRWLLLLPLLCFGCEEQRVNVFERSQTDFFVQAPTDAVDVLFIIDDSCSMMNHQAALAVGFDSFADGLDASGTDFQIGIVTTDMDFNNENRGKLVGEPPILRRTDTDYRDTFAERVQVGIFGSPMEKGLEAAEYALSPTMSLGANAGFLRDDAALLMIVVSDEEDCSDAGSLGPDNQLDCYNVPQALTPTAHFVRAFNGLKADPMLSRFAGIVGPQNPPPSCGAETRPGDRYAEVARLTGGDWSSICDTDWSSKMADLGLVATGIYTSFELSRRAREGTVEVEVDGAAVPESSTNGFTYDDEARAVLFHGDAVPGRGAEIVVTYVVASGG